MSTQLSFPPVRLSDEAEAFRLEVRGFLESVGFTEADTPAVVVGKTLLRNPTNRELADAIMREDGAPLSALTREQLRGHVVLIDFWTYSCINCLRALPYVTAWHERYKDKGLVVIGVHTPEFAFEADTGNVRQAIDRFDIPFPVAQDNDYATWKAFRNLYWPAKYLIDREGRLRRVEFGEGVAALGERDHSVEDAPVRVAEEVVRVDDFRGEIEGVVVQEDRAEDRTLGLEVVRQRAFGDSGVRHLPFPRQRPAP